MKRKILFLILFLFSLESFLSFASPPPKKDGKPKPTFPDRQPPKTPPPPPPKRKPSSNNNQSINFRGQRRDVNEKKLSVIKTFIEKKENGEFCVIVIFNQSINPSSLLPDNVILNGESIPLETKFTFNKKVDYFMFNISCSEIKSLELKNIEDIYGKKIDSINLTTTIKETTETTKKESL